ncbi:mechanosensitive ion channel [Segetibacter sp. 3557_3]|uniref:mechanosensitive ion channel family protein n=1 Tax=Segetibacter sp. 3557_3 TaxID=2547429 RepID=UPI001058E2A8|nr:mechanosensitive ion channel domain-containing protein [Segetibacter sp. 3557_3]TDH23040.1 mechanosensitive ion channel [Segetibacter sp. 3557_3]
MWNDLQSYIHRLPDYAWNLLLACLAIISGFIVKWILDIVVHFQSKGSPRFSFFQSVINRLGQPFTIFLPLLILNLVLPLMKLQPGVYYVIDKVIGILLIISFANILLSIVKVAEDYVYHYFDLNKTDNLKERKIRTQLQFVRKLVTGLIVILSICMVLLSFDSLRRVGAGLLTGVGVGGVILGFAAQRSLGNILAGLQIAFTQPMRIDDVLVVEGEWGRVEEITLTYVVLHIWDDRRLILPINYFIEKPFQNWTRSSAEISGTAFFYLDYTVPVQALREEFNRLLQATELWDKRVNLLQVTNTTDRVIEVRTLMSARNSSQAFDLRCYVRENLVKFVQDNYPDALPKTRAVTQAQNPPGGPEAPIANLSQG